MLPVLITDRLMLSPASLDQQNELWSIWNDRDVRRYLFDNNAVTHEAARELIDECLSLVDQGYGLWSIRCRDSSPLIGCVALLPVTLAVEFNPDLVGMVEPLISLAPAYWRQAYATEALAAVLSYGFNTLKLDEIAAINDVPNEASNRLLERLGFLVSAETEGPHYRLRSYLLKRDAFSY